MGESSDTASIIMDEIALEGLDGITMEGLFVRLKERPEFTSSLNDAYKQYIWNIICNMREIDMFELPEARKPLIIFNRYDYVDPEVGMVLEPETLPEEMYPHAPVDDKDNGIRGSCALYEERKSVYNIASQLTLSEVIDSWGTKLVIVASQKMRNLALMGSSVDPELELTILQYCILERVGRSRHLGEVTQGRVSLQITGEDPKALFYHRKFLMKNGLIVKQIHHQKSGTQNCSGSLLHLPRFYIERWPKVLFLTKRVIEILQGCKNYIADYEEIRKKLGLTNSLKKLFQTAYFQRFVRTDLRLPYRHLYPDARESEWRSLNSMKEKMIRVIQLLDPNADIDAISAKEDEYDIDEEEHGDATSSHEEFSVTLNRSFLSQAYQCIEGAGVNGYSQMQMVQKMGLAKLSARTVSRNLLKRGVATKFMNDVGRQRVSRFRARKWDQQCTRIQNIERDIQHMRAELLSKALGAGHEIPGGSVPASTLTSIQSNQKPKKRSADVSIDDLRDEMENRSGKRASDSDISGPPCKVLRTDSSEHVESSNVEMLNEHTKGSESTVPVDSSNSSSPLYCSVAKFQSKEAIRKNFRRHSNDGPVMTYRIFKRINMILEYVKIHKVVDDHSKFLKLINEEEEREGLNMKIDKKSLLRLLIRLKEDGRLKLHSYLLSDGVKVKTMMFICDRKIPLDHPAIVSAIEQAKMKLFIVKRDNINLAVAGTPTKDAQAQKAQNKKQKMTFVYDKKIGRKYGFCPKFIRMRTLHQFLFYLVYGYEGDPSLDQDTVIPFLESKDVTVDESLRTELTQTYVLDVHWKMFIPPLPDYPGWPKGWSIMCDLLLRLPLSVFVRIFNVCYVVAGLNEYLQHPVRRHFLVRQLPVPMRNGLMAFRKYIFSIHEVVQRLCYIGLVQFGPQRLKEKDQVLIFVNRRTNLLDTISSKPGYHQISEDEYPEMKYEFKCMQDVDTYWYNLWNICINTQLGGRMCVQGKDIVLEHLGFKPQMQEALQPVRPSRAPARDTGVVPGDRQGAAGLDSAIFAHLKRNWNWANITTKSCDGPPRKVDRRKYRLMNLKAAPVVFTKSAIIVKRSINYLHNGRFSALRMERRSHVIPPGAEVLPKKGQKGKPNVVRRIEVRKSRASSKPFYDDVDLKALQLMNKLRVEWSTEEDTLLLLCKVASMYLCPNPRQQTIAFSTIRDILHASIPEAKNKTSRACQRRILYIMKNLATSNNLAMHLEELKQDEDICERFGKSEDNTRGGLETSDEFEIRINEKFRLLVSELQGRSDRMVTTAETYCSTIPDQADDFWKLFDVVEPRTVIKSKGVFQDVKNVVDIHCSVVNSIIHSSLCSTTDKTSWAYQLFRVYQQYPDSLLRAAMAKLRQDQMVSLKKSYARYKQKANYLPLSSSPYQLSVSYLQLIQTKYQYGVYHEAYEMLKELLNWKEESNNTLGMPVTGVSGGGAATMVESLCKKEVLLSVEIPEQVIILDPWISEKDETYTRIVQRYRDILQTYRIGRDSTTSALFRRSLAYTKGTNEIDMEEEEADEEDDEEVMKAMECEGKVCKLPEEAHETGSHQNCKATTFSLRNESDQSLVNQDGNNTEVGEILLACCSGSSSPNAHLVEKTTMRNPPEGNVTTRCVVNSELQKKQSSDSQISEKHAVNIVTYNSQDESCLPLQGTEEESSHNLINSNKVTSDSIQKKNLIKCTLTENSSCSAELNDASLPTNNAEETSTLKGEEYVSKMTHEAEGKSVSKGNNITISIQEASSSSENMNTSIQNIQLPSEEMELSSQEESLASAVSVKSASCKKSTQMQVIITSLPCTDLVENENNIIEEDKLSKMKDQSNDILDSVQKVTLQETPSGTNELENAVNKRNILDTENTMSVKIDRTLNRQWGRLDFEWTSDKEWDSEADSSERVVEETEDADGVEDDRIRGDYISIVGETDDPEGVTPNNQQTLVARAASRIALFMMKEEMDDTCHVKNTQHAHDFFVVNSCSVFCKLCAEELACSAADDNTASASVPSVSSEEMLLPLTQQRIDDILDEIKNEIIVELEVPSEEEILKGVPESEWQSVMTLIHYIESKKHLGATVQQIQHFLENSKKLELANILSLLLQKRVLMRAGVTVPRYVHKRNIWPWLAHTFRFLRLEREKVVPSDSRVVSCSDETDENVMEVEKSEEIICDTKITSEEEVLETKMESESQELAMECVGSSSVSPVIKNAVDIEMAEEVHYSNSDEADGTSVKNKETLEMNTNNPIPMAEKIDDESETTRFCTENVEKEEVSSTTKRFAGHKTKLPVVHPLGTIVDTKDMRKAAQGLSFSERDEIHIAIRPWIRINGTLNRRVLDRLLGAVLGHAMYQPGQSLYAFGRRFQPALQPVHTRELIEILQHLGCLTLLVRQQRQKVTLFSKPEPIILVNADGTEDEQEIIVEPQADAICRLGQFIGEKSYGQDFMAAQEQMFSGRGPSEETSKRKRFSLGKIISDGISNELSGSNQEEGKEKYESEDT